MATKKKMLQAAAGNAGGAGLNVEDVFSTYLYEGTEASTQTITNNIDLSGEGGLVWAKARDGAINHVLMDTEQGIGKFLNSNQDYAQQTNSDGMKSFNSNGFTFGNQTGVGWSNDHVYWTFRKAPKFFDSVQWDGNGVAGRQIAHNLESVPGAIFVKLLNVSARDWRVYHRKAHATSPENYYLTLNNTNDAYDTAQYSEQNIAWNGTAPTDTHFTVGSDDVVNGNYNNLGWKYVAYIFAHNDGDGEFGPDGDADIIKCGSYTGNQNAVGPVIDLGFEPQWLLIKNASAFRPWLIIDVMRGTVVGTTNAGADNYLEANSSAAEQVDYYLSINATGFQPRDTGGNINASGETYIYMAIRRGTKVPESGTEVFMPVTRDSSVGGVNYYTGFPVDMSIYNARTAPGGYVHARLTSDKRLQTVNTNAEISGDTADFQSNVGYQPGSSSTTTNALTWNWKRAPGYFDVVAYTGTGSNRTVSHNLGAVPEMMWVKKRSSGDDWFVYVGSLGNTNKLELNNTSASGSAAVGGNQLWNSTTPTSSVFSVSDNVRVNESGQTYIAYLFASLDGISKVGSYDGDGTTDGSKVIDCGFTSGARFVMIKAYNTGGDFMVYDTERGIVVGNDPILSLNDTAAEATTYDNLVPNSSGFAVIQNTDGAYTTNESGHSYIFYAIA